MDMDTRTYKQLTRVSPCLRQGPKKTSTGNKSRIKRDKFEIYEAELEKKLDM